MSVRDEVRITVPLVPVGVNHYVKHTRNGRHYVTKEATAYKDALFYSALHCVPPPWFGKEPTYEIEMMVFQGKGDKGDVDNYPKCVLDGLKHAGVIHSDDAVKRLVVEKRRDRENPRTEIVVRAL